MRHGGGRLARQAYYDRNAAAVNSSSETTMAEAEASTTRFTYTVPTGKKASVAAAGVKQLGSIAATSVVAADIAQAILSLQPDGGTERAFLISWLHTDSFVAGSQDRGELQTGLVLKAADVIRGKTQFDGSVAGAGRIIFNMYLAAIEFDA